MSGRAPASTLVYRDEVGKLLTDCPVPVSRSAGTPDGVCGQSVVCHRRGDGYQFECRGGHTNAEIVAVLDPQVMLDLARSENGVASADPPPTGPFSLPVRAFVSAKHDAPPALIGTDDDCLLPARGLGMIIGRGGKGKTSLAVDLALHAAAGIDWLGIPIERPLRVLLLENEGPREMFRRKLERRLASWEHDLDDRLHVHVQSWAAFKLEEAGVMRLNLACDELAIDLVIGDPLDSLGMEGEGSPSEARQMVDRLKAAGLAERRAWLLLHHPRKANGVDAVDAASGDWGGRPDLILKLDKLDGNRAGLTFPKVRWGGRERGAHILAFAPDTGAFEFVVEQGTEQRDLAAETKTFLDAHPLRTAKEIAAPPPDGIGANEKAVRDTLEHSDQFDAITGDAAKAAKRHPTAVLWKVSRVPDSPDSPTERPGAHGGESGPLPPRRGGGPDSPAPPSPSQAASGPDSPDRAEGTQ